jgi:SAM-dependent methyltransferase
MGVRRLMPLVMIVAALIAACRSEKPAPDHRGKPAPAVPASSGSEAAAHDPAHPPIDCPLQKQGIDPAHLRPFEDVEKYIAFLDREDRAKWQKPDDVIAALGLEGTETVFDLGAGSGYFTFRFAAALPYGEVVAADTEAEMIRHIHHRAQAEHATNIEVKVIPPGDPSVPADADLIFMCDVLHHVANRSAWMGKLAAETKAGARLVLVEFKEGKLPEGPPEAAKIPRSALVKLATGAGFRLESERTDLLPYQVFLVFRKS